MIRRWLLLQHHSVVLRAETPAEMQQWWRRLKACAEGPGSLRLQPPRPQAPMQDGAGKKGAAKGAAEQSLDNYGAAGGNGRYGVLPYPPPVLCASPAIVIKPVVLMHRVCA